MKFHVAFARSVLVLGFVASLAGCATPASRSAMSVKSLATSKHYDNSVSVSVVGGSDASEGASVSNAEFKAAIENSIRETKLFNKTQISEGDYALSVFITSLERPSFGISMAVSMEAGWSLTRKSDGLVVLRKTISSTFTATPADALAGAKRVSMAVEGAARENVKQGLDAIAGAR